MRPENIYVLELSKQVDPKQRIYIRSPPALKPSQCTPLFIAAFKKRNARCCIHTHSQWAVLITLLLETRPANTTMFEINNIEQIKAFGKGFGKQGNLGYHDTLRIPVIENTPHEEDLTDSLEAAMDKYPDTYAVLVRRHGVYVWGDTVDKAKAQAERYVNHSVTIPSLISVSLDYLFQLAVEMKKLGIPWLSDIA
jgi:methylthioribulose-1-phosphate dehydratase